LDGALPVLRSLWINFGKTPGALPKVARALASGTSPLLEEFILSWDDVSDNDSKIIANMLEARASILGCKGLESFIGNNGWFNRATLAIQIRLLRMLLPSIKELPAFTCNPAFQSCFLDVQAPYLTRLDVCFEIDGGFLFRNVLAAAPALLEIRITSLNDTIIHAAVLHPVTVALRHGALQKLQNIAFDGRLVGDGNLKDFFDILDRSGCAKR